MILFTGVFARSDPFPSRCFHAQFGVVLIPCSLTQADRPSGWCRDEEIRREEERRREWEIWSRRDKDIKKRKWDKKKKNIIGIEIERKKLQTASREKSKFNSNEKNWEECRERYKNTTGEMTVIEMDLSDSER